MIRPLLDIKAAALRHLPIVIFWFGGLLLAALMNTIMSDVRPDEPISRLDSSLHLFPWITAQSIMGYAVLRPNTFSWSFGRSVAAMVISLLWTWFAILGGMHSPGWHRADIFCLLAADVALIILLVSCGIVSVIKRQKT